MTLLQSKAAGGPRSVLTDATTIGSVVTTDMLADNATESRHFIPLSDAGFTFIACMLGFTFVVGSFSNGLCLFVFIRNRRLRSPTNVFVMALNLVDFLMCFTGIPMAMTSAWNHKWIWGDAMCDFEAFLVYFLGMASMYVLMAIAFDRYIAISKPLLGTKITKSIAYVSCAGCYFLGFIWAIPPAFGWNEFGLEGAGISCSVVWENPDPLYMSYIWAIFFFCFIIPLGIMVYSYWGVLATLRNLNKNSVWDMNSRVARKNLAIEKKMFKTAVLIVASYWICWMPYTIVSFISAFIGSEIIPPLFATIPPVIAKCQGIFNPLILVTRHKAFQKAFFATFVVQRKRKQRTDYSMRVIEVRRTDVLSSCLLDPIIYVATNKQMRQAIFESVPCEGLRNSLLKEAEEPVPEADSEESDVEGTAKPKKPGPSGADKKAGSVKKAAVGGKGNKVHALKVEPSADEGVSEMSTVDTPGTTFVTPVQILQSGAATQVSYSNTETSE